MKRTLSFESSGSKESTMQPEKVTINTIEQEATRGWITMISETQAIQKKFDAELLTLQKQMTCNYRALMTKVEEENSNSDKSKLADEEIAKKWIRANLEEAQLMIDQVVGIKGITEDPFKFAAHLECGNVIAVNPEATLGSEVVAEPIPCVTISSCIVVSDEELYGY